MTYCKYYEGILQNYLVDKWNNVQKPTQTPLRKVIAGSTLAAALMKGINIQPIQ